MRKGTLAYALIALLALWTLVAYATRAKAEEKAAGEQTTRTLYHVGDRVSSPLAFCSSKDVALAIMDIGRRESMQEALGMFFEASQVSLCAGTGAVPYSYVVLGQVDVSEMKLLDGTPKAMYLWEIEIIEGQFTGAVLYAITQLPVLPKDNPV